MCVSNTNSCSNYLRKEYPGNECNGSSCTNRAAYEIQYVKDGFINEGDNFTLYFFVRDSYGVVTSTVLYDEVYHECDDTIGKYEYELLKKQYEKFTTLITECKEKFNGLPRFSNLEEIEKNNSIAVSSNSEALKNSTDIERYLLNFLSTPMDSEF